MSIVQDHKDDHKVGGENCLAVTEEQFCAMFYHVKERKSAKISFRCLEEWKCKIGNLKRLQSNPRARARTVVVYVRLTDRMGRLKFHARYMEIVSRVTEIQSMQSILCLKIKSSNNK